MKRSQSTCVLSLQRLCTTSRFCTVAAVYDRRQCRNEFFIFNIVGGHRPPLQFGLTIRYDFLCKAVVRGRGGRPLCPSPVSHPSFFWVSDDSSHPPMTAGVV